jgi:hypothetical protein
MKQSVESLREKCVSVCDSTVRATEDIRKKVDLVNHDFEVATYQYVFNLFALNPFHMLFILPFCFF